MRQLLLLFLTIMLLVGQASAIVDYYTFDEVNQTIFIYKNPQKWLEIKNLGIINDITEHREILQVYSNYRYDFSVLDDFKEDYEVHKGKSKVSDLSTLWYSQIIENYTIVVDEYSTQQQNISHEVLNNITGLNETIWYWNNQTVVVGNHTESRSRINESLFNPLNKKINAGQTLTFIKVTKKKAEAGEFSILLKPMFMGVSLKELTWWNGSWGKKRPIYINNTNNAAILTNFQINLNVTYDSDMNVDFSDLRVANDSSGLTVAFWNESIVNSSYANIWFNASSIPASVWTNSTYYLYYGNPSAVSASNGTNTMVKFDDFSGSNSLPWIDYGTTHTIEDGVLKMPGGGDYKMVYVNMSLNDYIVHVKFNAPIALGGAEIREGTVIERHSADNHIILGGINSATTVGHAVMGIAWYNVASLGFTAQVGTWYEVNTIRQTNVQKTSVQLVGRAINYQSTSAIAYLDTKIAGVTDGYGNVIWYDDFYVRKYASPEPNALLGVEESISQPLITSNSTSRTFMATWNTTVDVVWYWNSTSIQTNNSVTSASYTNSSLINGTHNITASGTNLVGNASITWFWTISPAQAGEAIREFIQVIII